MTIGFKSGRQSGRKSRARQKPRGSPGVDNDHPPGHVNFASASFLGLKRFVNALKLHMAEKECAQLEFRLLTAFFVKQYFLQSEKKRLKLMARLIKQLLVMPSLYTNIKGFCCIEVSMKRQTF